MSRIINRLEAEAKQLKADIDNMGIYSEGKYGTPVSIDKIERMSKIYTSEEIRVPRQEFDAAKSMACQFLKEQRRDDLLGDSSHLPLEKGAIIKFYPAEARGKIEVKMLVSGAGHNDLFVKPSDVTIKPTDVAFRQEFMKAGSPDWCKIETSPRLQMRLERLASPSKPIEHERRTTISHDDYRAYQNKEAQVVKPEATQQQANQIALNLGRTTAKTKQWDTQHTHSASRR